MTHELQQIRTMAELILEKVSALEGAKSYTKDIGFDHLARDYDAKFDRDRNGSLYDRGGADAYYGRSRNPHWYPMGTYKGDAVKDLTTEEVAEYNAGYDACSEPKATKEPKFKVGDHVQLIKHPEFHGVIVSVNVAAGSVSYNVGLDGWVGADNVCIFGEADTKKYEPAREWHSGPPPHVGWWNASLNKDKTMWRWWDGEQWSAPAFDHLNADDAANNANFPVYHDFLWSDYYPENARVPRVNPGVKV